ncbi:glutamyl-tRNA reductase [Natronomonas sp.]|uniref:glutamyl-tRNA reductase n=1 Tax=Natronomonas sp. TaxID=2184060 RepID=UPI002602E03E|nr:glutamyl-tRNA reductase [Natronomonas sp.]
MTTRTDVVVGVSVSHSDAAIEDIERAAAASGRAAVESLMERPGVSEAFVLQTCNRAEAYVVTEEPAAGRDALSAYLGGVDPAVVRELDHEGSLRHLMRVACGLESLVVGEDQILGQFREAYESARGVGAVGVVLDDALLKALHVGERARSETAINEGTLSLGSAAVRFAAAEHELEGATGLVIGAGEIATLAAEALDERVGELVIANRTLPHAEHVASQLRTDASAVGLDALSEAIEAADVVVSATGSADHVVGAEAFETAGETCVVDIAQPRDVPAAAEAFESVSVYDLDEIETVTDGTRRQRRAAAESVEAMIDSEFEHLMQQYKRRRADQVIAAMYEGAERMKTQELRTAMRKLESERGSEIPEAEREIVNSMADALVSQLLSAPTQSLRDAAENDEWSTIRTALTLFGPAFDIEPAEPPEAPDAPESPESIPAEMRDRMPDHVLEQLTGDDE